MCIHSFTTSTHSFTTPSAPNRRPKHLVWLVGLLALAWILSWAQPAEAGERYLKLVAGIGDLDDGGSLDIVDDRLAASTDSSYDLGFRSGLAFGWRPSPRFALEGEYLYSTNDLDEVVLADGRRFEEGNYASVTLSANGYAFFRHDQKLQPYVGAGLAWVQEVDIDFEENGEEISFETDDFGFQIMAGLHWQVGERWALDLQARYLAASGLTMEAEEGPGRVTADYEPWSVLAGWSYRF